MKNPLIYSLLILCCLTTFAGDELKPVPQKTEPTLIEKKVPFEGDETSSIIAPKEVSGIGKKDDPFIFTKATRCILELQGKTEGVSWDLDDAPTDTVLLNNQYASFSLYQDGLFQIIAHGDSGVYCKVWFSIKSGTDPPPDPQPNPDDDHHDDDNVVPKPGKLMVIIIKDDDNLAKVPASQISAMYSTKLRDYARTHCLTGTDGKTPELKLLDINTDLKKESPLIQEGYKAAVKEMKAAGALTWITLSNGTQGFSGPLPENEDKTIELVKKYGGE